MGDARQPAGLFDGGRAFDRGGRFRNQLQRDFALDARVPGAIHIAEGAAADLLQDDKWSPSDLEILLSMFEGRKRDVGTLNVGIGRFGCPRSEVVVNANQPLDQLQASEKKALGA